MKTKTTDLRCVNSLRLYQPRNPPGLAALYMLGVLLNFADGALGSCGNKDSTLACTIKVLHTHFIEMLDALISK